MKLYQKIGRRYYPAESWFNGEPAEGIWLVEETTAGRSRRVICRVGELPDLVPLAKAERHRERVNNAIVKEMSSGTYSVNDITTAVLMALAKSEQE